MLFKSLLNDLKTGNPLGKTAVQAGKEKLFAPLYSLPLGIGSTIANLRGRGQNQGQYIPDMDTEKKQLDASYKIIEKLDGLNKTMMGIQDTLKQQSTVYDELLDDAEKQQDPLNNKTSKQESSTSETKLLDAEAVDNKPESVLKELEELGEGFLGLKGLIGLVGGAGLLGAIGTLTTTILASVGTITALMALNKPAADAEVASDEARHEAMKGFSDPSSPWHTPKEGDFERAKRKIKNWWNKTDNPDPYPEDAEPVKGSTDIKTPDGSVVRRTGGSISWRDNNPGNLKGGKFSKEHGATGEDSSGFAVFPSPEMGDAARRDLLFGPNSKYKDLPVSQAIAKYAPPEDGNDTRAYQAAVLKAVNGDDIPLKDLPEAEKTAMLDAMKAHEGWKVGKEEVVSPTHPEASFAAPPGLLDIKHPDNPDGEMVPPKEDAGVKFHADSKEKAEAAAAPVVVPVPMPSGSGSGGGGSRTVVSSPSTVVTLGSSPPPNSVDINSGH